MISREADASAAAAAAPHPSPKSNLQSNGKTSVDREGGKEEERGGEGDLQSNGLFPYSPPPPPLHHLSFWTTGREREAKDDLRGYFSPMDDDKSTIGGGGVRSRNCGEMQRRLALPRMGCVRQRSRKTEFAGSKKRQGSARASGNVTDSGKNSRLQDAR